MHSISDHLAARRDNFLLLRIVAAVMVIYGHSYALTRDTGATEIFLRHGWRIYSGDIAVDIFFVISGFMVSGSYLAGSGLFSYMAARFLRIVPAYAFILVLSALVIGPLFTTLDSSAYFASPDVLPYVAKNLRFSSDMAWTLPGVFEGHRMTAINGSLWTLPAEMRMYLLVAALGVFGFLGNRALGLLAALALLLAAIFDPQLLPVHSDWVRLGGFFCIGILAQLFKDSIQVRHDAMLGLVVLTYISYNTHSYMWLLAAAIAYFSFWFAYRTPIVGLEKYGDPSYGIYLWGWPAQQMLLSRYPGMTPMANFLGAVVIAVAAGYLSWYLIERPALSLKGRIRQIRSHPLFLRVLSWKVFQS
jgi:peptidoglycan/LPS O-acetylase OafA/YrhL